MVLIITLSCSSCAHAPLSKPFLVVSLDEVELFVEGADITQLITINSGNLKFEKTFDSSAYEYTASGRGTFVVYNHSCQYSTRKLHCDSKEVDISLGAVIFRKNGVILPYNLLPLVTR